MLTLYHDYTCPASAVAVARAERLAAEGAAVEFRGLDRLGVDLAVAVPVDVLAALDAVIDAAAAEEIALRRPRLLPPTFDAHLVGTLAEETGCGAPWRRRCYEAFWRDGVDLADGAVLAALARGVGLDPAAVGDRLADRERRGALRRRMAADRREGVGGVPVVRAQRTLVPGLLALDELRLLAALDVTTPSAPAPRPR